MAFNNKILGSHYIVKQRPPYKKDFDDADICIVGNIRIDENNERQLYTPSFTVTDSYLKDEKSVSLVSDIKEGKIFNSIDFRKFDLGGAKLEGGNFELSTFDEANMMGVKMKGAKLKGASLRGADLRGADLSGADLEGADLRFCNLEGAKLDGANLSGALIEGAFFKAAKLTNIKADKKTLSDLEELMQMLDDLVKGKLNIKDIPKEWLGFIDLKKMDLTGMDLTGFDLRLIHTVGVDLSSATLSPDQVDGSYMFKSGASNEGFVKIARGNTAGLDLTSANLINEEIEDEKRRKQLRHVFHKHAKDEALKMIEEHRKSKNPAAVVPSYLKMKPPVKKMLSLSECDGVDLEERILVMEKNKMINPQNEWDIPRSMAVPAIDKAITADLMSDIKPSDYGPDYEKELIEKERAREQLEKEAKRENRKAKEQAELEELQKMAEDNMLEQQNTNETLDLTNIVSKETRQHLKLNVKGARQYNKN